jgi:integrase
MSDFKGRRFPTDLILLCVRWYCKFGISYRDLEEMMGERGVAVDHTTLFRWVQRVEALLAYIAAADIAEDRKGWLLRTSRGHNATVLSGQPMNQSDAWRMIRQRAVAAGIHAPIGNRTFRATGITAYLANGGALEHTQEMAAHESPRTT